MCVKYNNMTLCFYFIGSGLGTCRPWLLAPVVASLEGLFSMLSTLSKAHLGYLHWVSAFLRWSTSLWRSSGLLHTVWALWVRVLITLNFAERWWWLSHCRYWSVWVDFSVHSHGQIPISLWVYNGVQEGDGTILLLGLLCKLDGRVNTVNAFRRSCLWSSFWMTNVSSTYLNQSLWGGVQYWELFAQSTPCIG